MQRRKMSRRGSRREFGRSANRSHIKNQPPAIQRGGTRL